MGSILVTGCAGFIGYHLVQALCGRGDRVVGLDNLNAYYDTGLKKARLDRLRDLAGFSFVEGDVGADGFEDLPGDIDRVVHLAAQAGVRYSITHPAAYVHSNLAGHANMLEFARRRSLKKAIYASSSSIYGGNSSIPFAETDVTDDPVSFYGATKKANELMARSYSRLYGLDLTGLRFFTVYGPWGRPDMAYWIFSEKLSRGEPLDIFNEGRMGRDFTFIDDCTLGIVAALDRPNVDLPDGVPHRIYNLGNDSPEELMTLVTLLERFMGREGEKVFREMQKGDVERTWANIDRARKELGYDPRTPLATGLERFVDWYREWAA